MYEENQPRGGDPRLSWEPGGEVKGQPRGWHTDRTHKETQGPKLEATHAVLRAWAPRGAPSGEPRKEITRNREDLNTEVDPEPTEKPDWHREVLAQDSDGNPRRQPRGCEAKTHKGTQRDNTQNDTLDLDGGANVLGDGLALFWV